MSYYRRQNAVPVPVGVINQSVVAAVPSRGEDFTVIYLENASVTETFVGVISTAPTANGPWTDEADDAFNPLAPQKARRARLPPDRLWVRVLGNFLAAPGTVNVTVDSMRDPTWVRASG